MKKRTRIICMVMSFFMMTGCIDNFEKYNTDPYAIYKADPSVLLPAMIEPLMYVQQNNSQMIDQMVGSLGGYFTLSNRWGGQNFDTFNASDGWNAQPFNIPYNALVNIFDIEKATNKSGHYYAMAILLKAGVLMRVADCYGAIPYSKIADKSFYVEYDKTEDVYAAIIADLTTSAATLFQYSQAYPSSYPLASNDPVYSGDYALWARLANSLALRAALRSGDRKAAEEICASSVGLIETNTQNAFMSTGVQGNPYQVASTSWGDLRVNASIVDYMDGYEDPRLSAYFLKSAFDPTRYIGMRSGEAAFDKSDVTKYSLPNIKPESPLPICLASEVSFIRAECALNGWNVGGTAQSFYEKGITLSMEQYGVNPIVIAGYIDDNIKTPKKHTNDPRGAKYNYARQTTVKIKWGADNNEQNLERIITQKWIACYPMGLEAWTEYRRTGFPELASTIDNLNTTVITNTARGLRRLRYPYTERDLNRANYDDAVKMIGGKDDESVDLFWNKKE